MIYAYKGHLITANDRDPNRLDESIALLHHTSGIVELFSDKHAIYHVNDIRLKDLLAALQFFSEWKSKCQKSTEFLSTKLWFDLQSMILGFISLVEAKLVRFPGTVIKPAIINQDIVENHFSQLRAANGQNEHPTYLLTQATQNSIIFGQTTISKKSNTGAEKISAFTHLPKKNPFSKK